MVMIEKALLRAAAQSKRVIDIDRGPKLDKVRFAIPEVPGDVVIEAWIGSRVTFSAIVNGDTVRLHPKSGVRYDNLEQWLRETVKPGD